MYSVLNVYLLDRFVGRLSHETQGNVFSFQYDPEYLKNPAARRLSYALPLIADPFDSQTTYGYFANLLPPEYVRRKLEKCLHISRNNVFGYLKALGGDCAGAVSIYPEGMKPNPLENPQLRTLTEDEAVDILKSLRQRPLYANGETGYRYSGAGAQDKLIARVMDGKVVLPLFGTPSTHLIKPASADFPDSVENEFFCQTLCGRLGLRTAKSFILELKGERYFATERYDRTYENEAVRRLHQEDFCQMLSIDPESKYEEQGGPTAPQCLEAIKGLQMPPLEQLAFVDAIAFTFLIGNADAHAKNYSILYHGEVPSFAPLYDEVSTAVYPALSRELAMSIGSEKRMEKIRRAAFVRFADDCGINPRLILARLDGIATKIVPAAESLEAELSRTFPSPVYDRILAVIRAHRAQIGG